MIYLFLIFPLFIIVIVCSPIHIELHFEKKYNYKDLKMIIYFTWGLVKIPINLLHTKTKMQQNKIINPTKLFHRKTLIHFSYAMLLTIVKFLTLHRLHLNLKYGCGEAIYTGIFGGISWTIVGNLLAILNKIPKAENYYEQIDLKPNYQRLILQGIFNCQISFRIVHLIIAAISGVFFNFQRRFTI